MCLPGGMGTALGPIVCAIVVVLLENQLASLGVIRLGVLSIGFSTKAPIMIGIVFMLYVLLFRRGIVGNSSHFWASAGWPPRRRQGTHPDPAAFADFDMNDFIFNTTKTIVSQLGAAARIAEIVVPVLG